MTHDLIDNFLNAILVGDDNRLSIQSEREGHLIFTELCNRSPVALAFDIYTNCQGQLLLWVDADMG